MVRNWGELVLALALSVASGGALAAGVELHKSLIGALTCAGAPMDLMHDLASAGSARSAEGMVGYEIGEEMDAISGVALTAPLQLGAATTHNVVASMMSFYEGFGGFVHAKFDGDYRPIVTELKLTQAKPGESYKRALPVESADEVCPKTIELFPHADGQFLLGCTWCNG